MNLPQREPPAMLENPFFHRGPIRDRRYFFGRTRETSRALRMLRNGQCVSIVGPRRIGKTSLLFHLCDPEVRKRQGLGGEYLFVYLNCEGLGDLNKPQFCRYLWQEARRTLAERGEADGWAERISTFSELRDVMIALQEKGHRPTLLFDEFDTVARNTNLDRHVFSDLRSLAPTVAVYATASHDSLYHLTYADQSVLSSPFFNIFEEIRLGFLSRDEAGKMVRGLLGMAGQEDLFTKEDLAFALQAGGSHPFFLQLACSRLFDQKTERGELAAADYGRVRQQFAEDAEAHFHYAWKNLDASEREAARLMGEGGASQLDGERRRRLERKCILHDDAFFSLAFAEFVRGRAIDAEASEATEARVPEAIEAKVSEAVEEGTDEIITRIDQMDEEIKSVLARFPFANVKFLGNFEGFVLIEIADGRGNLVPLSKEKPNALSEGQTYQLRVTIQSKEPLEGVFDCIRLTDGQDVPSVDFAVLLDCDSLTFQPGRLEFTVKTQETEAITKTAHLVTEKGNHDLFVEVLQKSALVQVIHLELRIQ